MVTEKNVIVYLDLRIGDEKIGRVVLELFKSVCPLTSENFRALCTGEKGIGKISGKPLHYKGSIFHKSVSQFMIQGGDITHFNGTGGESIYGASFEDENFKFKHTQPGMLSMANAGPNSNNSQFFITTVPCPHLDNTNVVFGKVTAGLGVVEEISTSKSDKKDRPFKECVIEDCGELKFGEDWNIEENDGTEDIYPPFPGDWRSNQLSLDDFNDVIIKIKRSGNHFFGFRDYVNADRKYKKALRYIEWTKLKCKDIDDSDLTVTHLNTTEVVCLLNLSAVYLKMKCYREALEKCDQVLKIDNQSAKAFYRRGQARVKLNDYEMALNDLETALAIVPDDKSIKKEICAVKKIIKKYLVLEKKFYEKMLK